MKTACLKCTYGKGLFKEEYLINFDGKNQSRCCIKRGDLTLIDKQNGYVKCHLVSQEKQEAVIWINDIGDKGLSPFRVKTSDLVSRLKVA